MRFFVDFLRIILYYIFMNNIHGDSLNVKIIARLHSDFPSKFAVPRQSGMHSLSSFIVFEPEFRKEGILSGLEEFSHLWALWIFSHEADKPWSPTVRPPKLGGNVRKGVFATRSPFRPNPIGMSCLKIVRVIRGDKGPVIEVSGADMTDGTPIIDIKPYVPYADCRPEAKGGFSTPGLHSLRVNIDDKLLSVVPEEKRKGFTDVLALDPRPAYHNDPERIYKFEFSGLSVAFCVDGDVLTVVSVKKLN